MLCSAPLEFAVVGLLWSRLPALTSFCKTCSGTPPEEVPGLELDLGCFWLQSTALEISGSYVPRPTKDLLTPSEVPDSCSDRRVSRFLPTPFDVPDQYPDPQRSWLSPTSSEDPDSWLDLPRCLFPAYSLGGPRFTHAQTGRGTGSVPGRS